jgi:hypothetical protein
MLDCGKGSNTVSKSTFSGPVISKNGFKLVNNSSQALTYIQAGSISVNPASIATLASAETAVTIAGAAVGDIVIMNVPAALETGLVFSGARVSAANTVQVRLSNITAGAVDGAALTWTYQIIRIA